MLLLRNGADPTIPLTQDFGSPPYLLKEGSSVLELSATSSFRPQFEEAIKNGANPNLINPVTKEPLMIALIRRGAFVEKRVKLLVEAGANLDCQDGERISAPMAAVARSQQYTVALYLLEAGASHRLHDKQPTRLIHYLIMQRNGTSHMLPEEKVGFQRVLDWLIAHGESVEEAEEELKKVKATKTALEREQLRKEMDARMASK